jgi:hypothetical protein
MYRDTRTLDIMKAYLTNTENPNKVNEEKKSESADTQIDLKCTFYNINL